MSGAPTVLPVQIVARDIALSPAMEADIRERATALLSYFHGVLSCRVTVELPTHRHRSGSLHRVEVDLVVPGGELVVRRRPHEDLRTAVQIAFNGARRRLREYGRRRRGAVKARSAVRWSPAL